MKLKKGRKRDAKPASPAAEKYTTERKAEFFLSNATSKVDYLEARRMVRRLGLDPDSIPHVRPA